MSVGSWLGRGNFLKASLLTSWGPNTGAWTWLWGRRGGGVAGPRWPIPLKQVASWEVHGTSFFGGVAGHARPSRHLPCSALGADVIDPDVVSDGEVTEGGRSDGAHGASGQSDRSSRSDVQRGKKRAANDSTHPPPQSWRRLLRAMELQPHRRKRPSAAPFVTLDLRARCPWPCNERHAATVTSSAMSRMLPIW